MQNQTIPTNVITGKARLSYVNLFEARAQNGGEPKYGVTVLIPKGDTQTMDRVKAAIDAAIQEGVSKKWNGQRPPKIDIPVHDGDGARPSDGQPFGDECKGHYVFTASSKQQPGVVDQQVQRIIDSTEVYSGMYGRVSVNFFPYNANGKKGIGVGLNNVQKIADGEPLSGRRSAEQEFSAVDMPPVYSSPQAGQASNGGLW